LSEPPKPITLPEVCKEKWLLLAGVIVYGTTAWCSVGHYGTDEHFQILEFANYKLGLTPINDLPWEFPARVRSGLQPMLAYGAIRAADTLGANSPFTQVFLLRLITGLLCLWMYFGWRRHLAESPDSKQTSRRMQWVVEFL